MLERDNGRIINIASVSGIIGPPNFSDYAASKHGVMGFTKTLVAEYLLRGIRAPVILPGGTVSQMQREASPKADPATLIQPEDIADAAVFLATQPASAHTMEIVVNKGLQTRYLDD